MSPTLRTPARVFAGALLALLAGEILRIYWIMPFPGSQRGETLAWAYALHRSIWGVRLVAGGLVLWAAVRLLRSGSRRSRIATLAALGAVAVIAYQTNGPMSADVMFRQPATLTFTAAREARASSLATLPPSALVVGISLTGPDGRSVARAYPIRYIGVHHQVRDEVAGQPVMVTYCTVCRTGRVFRPVVDGRVERFRLVGMDHFNAMFEDATTGSWWRQATGEAVIGRLKGARLEEIPSRQTTWAQWAAMHPETDLMDPDPAFAERYAHMVEFEDGTNESRLTGRDPGSWNDKSWVVGVLTPGAARAFDWNELVRERLLVDRVGELPVVLLLDADDASFAAFVARDLDLTPSADRSRFVDSRSGTVWSATGVALEGPDAGKQLEPLPAYQEFWHSWRTFHPETTARRQ